MEYFIGMCIGSIIGTIIARLYVDIKEKFKKN